MKLLNVSTAHIKLVTNSNRIDGNIGNKALMIIIEIEKNIDMNANNDVLVINTANLSALELRSFDAL